MANENCFLLLGKTGVGKSTFAKILSENPNIRIGNSLSSETKEAKGYECTIDNFRYTLIDTPGYDDTNQNDTANFSLIQQFLTSTKHKIKGIVLIFSFQDSRFRESHRKGLSKIAKLIPLENFWNYVTNIITKTFWDEPDELEAKKKAKLEDFKGIFDTMISAFNNLFLIKKVKFSNINTIFVNLKENKTKKENLESITKIFKKNSYFEPLFHQIQIEEKWEEIMILHKDNQNVGDLFNVKFKVKNYLSQIGKVIKKISIPIEKQFIKQLDKKENNMKFRNICENIGVISGYIVIPSIVGSLSTAILCPPIFTAFLITSISSILSFVGSAAIAGIKEGIQYRYNREFNEKTVIDELLIEDDI